MVKVTVNERQYLRELGRKTVVGEELDLDKEVVDALNEQMPGLFKAAKKTAQGSAGATRKKAAK